MYIICPISSTPSEDIFLFGGGILGFGNDGTYILLVAKENWWKTTATTTWLCLNAIIYIYIYTSQHGTIYIYIIYLFVYNIIYIYIYVCVPVLYTPQNCHFTYEKHMINTWILSCKDKDFYHRGWLLKGWFHHVSLWDIILSRQLMKFTLNWNRDSRFYNYIVVGIHIFGDSLIL